MGFQQMVIQGAIAGDAEKKVLPSGAVVVEFNVPVNETWKDATTGEKKEDVTWYRVKIWGKRGESLLPYLKKGKAVMIIGKVKAKAYIAQDGEARANLELKCDSFQFVTGQAGAGGAGSNEEGGSAGGYDDYAPPPQELDDIPF